MTATLVNWLNVSLSIGGAIVGYGVAYFQCRAKARER